MKFHDTMKGRIVLTKSAALVQAVAAELDRLDLSQEDDRDKAFQILWPLGAHQLQDLENYRDVR